MDLKKKSQINPKEAQKKENETKNRLNKQEINNKLVDFNPTISTVTLSG